MKHLTAIFLMILCLNPFCSCAEGQPALFPIRENGLWGYVFYPGCADPVTERREIKLGEEAVIGMEL